MLFVDRKFRIPRNWSNQELKKIAHLFKGSVVNVSGYNDSDKEGGAYKHYFSGADKYLISNYKEEKAGVRGIDDEFYLDLEEQLPEGLARKFDVVFNHTVLEHVFEVGKAFENLCEMSSDVVVLVTPFLQEVHAYYGDYWRFTPRCIEKLFQRNGFSVVYQTFNSHSNASVYCFTIASRNPSLWEGKIPKVILDKDPKVSKDRFMHSAGCHAVNNLPFELYMDLRLFIRKYFYRLLKK